MPAGDKREGLVEVPTQFLDRAGLAWVISCGLDPSPTEFSALRLESADVVALPTVQRDRD